MSSLADLRGAVAATAVSGRTLAIVVGPLGGGPEVAGWVVTAMGGHGVASQAADGTWTWPGGRVRDLTTASAAGPSPEPGAAVDVLAVPPRSPRSYDQVVDLRFERETARAWFAELFPGSELAQALAPAGRIVSEATGLRAGATAETRLDALPAYQAYESSLLHLGGARFLDFARVVALVHPRAVHVGDEWVQLANHLGGRSWSVADLSIVLLQCHEAFAIRSIDGVDEASFSSPFLVDVISSRVPTSASEHYALFKALRDMAVRSLLRSDPGDRFVAKELPLQALAGNAVEELCDDGMALLAADPQALVDVIENADTPVSQGAKLVIRAAHRLGRGDTLSQLELAARRSGLVRLADQIAVGSPERQWRPIWATSQPVNTSRVVFSAAANVLCLDSLPGSLRSACLAGLSSGQVWRVDVSEPPRLVWQDDIASEVRCLASVELGGRPVVFTGHSNQVVRAVAVDDGTVQWVDGATMTGPLSAITVGPDTPHGVLVIAGGVDGRLVSFRAIDGTLALPVVDLGAEIRGVCVADDLVLACLVDGTVAAIRLSDGSLAWRVAVPGRAQVCNALAVAGDGQRVVALVGTASGSLFELELELGLAGADQEPTVREVLRPGSSVNAIRAVRDGGDFVVYLALSDASWLRTRLSTPDPTSYLGHVGAVNALLVLPDGRVLSGGGEGTVRSWLPRFIDAESITLEWGVRHRGPVTGINIDLAKTVEDVMQVTGGHDGSIRAWSGSDDVTGTLVAEHDSPVKALIWDSGRATVYAGHADGVLRTVTREDGAWSPRLVGIQHDGVRALTLSPEGQLFSAGVDGTVTRWQTDLLAGAVTRRVSDFGHVSAISWLHQSLVVGAQDGKVTLLEPNQLEPLLETDLGVGVASVAGHERAVFAGLANGEVVAMQNFGRLDATQSRRLRLHNGEIRGIQAFELAGNVVIVTTGLDRRLVVTDLRTSAVLADVALDGFGLGLHATAPYVAVSTTSGAMILELSPELPGFLALPRPGRG